MDTMESTCSRSKMFARRVVSTHTHTYCYRKDKTNTHTGKQYIGVSRDQYKLHDETTPTDDDDVIKKNSEFRWKLQYLNSVIISCYVCLSSDSIAFPK